jgi:hypothetical protein
MSEENKNVEKLIVDVIESISDFLRKNLKTITSFSINEVDTGIDKYFKKKKEKFQTENLNNSNDSNIGFLK